MTYAKDEKVEDRALRSAYVEDLEEIRQAFELSSCKKKRLSSRLD